MSTLLKNFFSDFQKTALHGVDHHILGLGGFTVLDRRHARPALERTVKRAGLGETGQIHNLVDGLVGGCQQDRKSTRLNSSHVRISYAVFCLKKKNTEI